MAKSESTKIEFGYFHDYESEQFAFYRIPKVLFTDEYFRNLSSDAKVLYGLMLDRMALSIRNNWVDNEGKVYIIFTLEQVMEYMNCGKDKGVKILAELDTDKGIGLIERVKRGLGKPTIIYVKSFVYRKEKVLDSAENDNRSQEVGKAEVKSSEKPKSGVLESRSQEFGKTEVWKSEKSKSRVRKNRSTEVGKTDPNNTNYNYTDISNTDRSNTDLINLSDSSEQQSINESAVLTLVSDTLRAIAEYSRNDRTEFIHTVQETQVAQQSADISKKRRRLAAAQKRAGELEKLICKIYEDNALGKLPDARYKALDAQYAKEQDALEIEIAELEKAVTGYEQSQKSAEKFIALIDKYENFDTLTNTMLNEFVEKILVHERARKGSQDTTQEVEIYFNFVGRYIPPALQPVPLTPEEQEELRKKEERKDRLHQNYLRRKANGKQKEWEKRYNAKRKAQVEAAKATIRAEDMEKGIFTTVSQLPRQEPRKATVSASATV